MKKVLALFLAMVIMLPLVACGNKVSDNNDDNGNFISSEQTENIDKPEENTEEDFECDKSDEFIISENEVKKESTLEVNFKNPASVAMAFIQGLTTNEYDVVISALNIDNSPFVFAEDIIFGYSRSEYGKLADYAGQEVYLMIDKNGIDKHSEAAAVTVKVMNIEDKLLETLNVSLVLNKENKWVVDDGSFYIKDYYVSIPGKTTLSINNVEVSKDYFDSECGHSGLKEMYKINFIGKSEKEFEISCEKYESLEKIVPIANNKDDALNLVKDLEGEELQEALKAVKDLWGNLYNDYCNEVPISDLTKYFADNVDTQVYSDIYKGFEQIRKGSSGYPYIDHRITFIEQREGAPCFYITDEVIVLNFQYQVDWVWDFSLGGPKNGRRVNHILLEKTEDGYKIYEVSAISLFNDVSGSEW